MNMQTDQQTEVENLSPEQASTNMYWTFGKNEVFNLQTTIRGIVHPAQVEYHLKSVKVAMNLIIEMGGHAKPIGQQPLPPRADTPSQPTGVFPTPQPVPIATPQPTGGAHEAQCVLIEVGTSYQGNKTQLKFTCNGMDYPLLYTKSVGEMATLLSPLGFTPAHIVVGQKYPINCRVFYVENVRDGKPRKDVQRVAVG